MELWLGNRRQLFKLFARRAQRDRNNYWDGHLYSECIQCAVSTTCLPEMQAVRAPDRSEVSGLDPNTSHLGVFQR